MYWRKPLMLAALVFGVQYFLEYRDWLDWNKGNVLRTVPGPCKVVKEGGGSEDVFYIGNNIVLLTQGYSLLKPIGSIMALNLTTNKVTTLNITNAPSRTGFMASPHGMTVWRDPDTDQLYVYVLTHHAAEDSIEVFEVSKSLTLNYIKTITDPHFQYFVWTGKNYVFPTITQVQSYTVAKLQFHIVASHQDQLYVYVLTHHAVEDSIEVFEVSKSLTLNYIKSITDPHFQYMNDLVAVGKDQFYITGFFKFRYWALNTLESLVRWRAGNVMYYDSNKARVVASGFLMANGINISPDKSMIYMAEFGYKKLHGFHREASNNLVHAWEIDLGTTIDNIDVHPDTGDLWLGCHPRMYKIIDLHGWFDFTHPSQVLRLKVRDKSVSSVEQIYADNGSEIEGSSVATYVNGKLVIGSVAAQAVVCEVKYLSP